MMRLAIIFHIFSVVLGSPQNDFQTEFIHPKERLDQFFSRKSIINGNVATPHQFPYQVGIFVKNPSQTDFCGGSLISSNYVLTAAHCVDNAVEVTLIFGAHNITTVENTQVRLVSTEFIIHSEWDSDNFNKNDIALIKLPNSISETTAIKIITLAKGTDTYAEQSSVVAGWGITRNSQSGVTPTLRYITPYIISNADCKNVDSGYDAVILDTLMCTSGESNRGTCSGDSGGPLAVNGIQVGIVSFGSDDCEAGKPSVFTRVTKYADWIMQNSDVQFI
ncbi:brachyurin-like isoform X1 [Diorhabda sublineata]|uniref:brachyurin-like isoform X1 n=1 Tax=Diorhabda sublineata TaxID=1163346 RepID=UPI0024E0BF02|nr:brachyurin-like isoform X1 [Diorhabda sublineata]